MDNYDKKFEQIITPIMAIIMIGGMIGTIYIVYDSFFNKQHDAEWEAKMRFWDRCNDRATSREQQLDCEWQFRNLP